jgi:hypothetical protein
LEQEKERAEGHTWMQRKKGSKEFDRRLRPLWDSTSRTLSRSCRDSSLGSLSQCGGILHASERFRRPRYMSRYVTPARFASVSAYYLGSNLVDITQLRLGRIQQTNQGRSLSAPVATFSYMVPCHSRFSRRERKRAIKKESI